MTEADQVFSVFLGDMLLDAFIEFPSAFKFFAPLADDLSVHFHLRVCSENSYPVDLVAF